MTSEADSSVAKPAPNPLPSNLQSIITSENSLFPITDHKFNGSNYNQWSHSVMIFICEKGKEDYIIGTTVPPEESSARYRIWKVENHMVMSWLLNSMTITDYFNALIRYWHQLDMLEDIEWHCPEDNQQYKKILEKERIYKSLLCLNKEFDEVRGRILSIKTLPSVREVFSEVC
ncbi:UBN2_3 domain-containing protein [Cephalotus follicularis]|uniref:UBN2_3 domain-containing protein n=1 Tax=Cephalotus follicularis TaxID=3775 RepID=A0A1Q3CWR9_CEPFO|nr:UBN2_3 domain-containing protein [Cephalotus follicularis]